MHLVIQKHTYIYIISISIARIVTTTTVVFSDQYVDKESGIGGGNICISCTV
jgi:hypothetical protein